MSVSSLESDASSGSDSSDNESISEDIVTSNAPVVEGEKPTDTNQPKKKPFWAPKHIVFMKGLPYVASPDEIKNFFADCGEITSLTRQLGDDGRWNGCVFVKFSTREGLDAAISLDGAVWTGNGAGILIYYYFLIKYDGHVLCG